jgi:hypothetical protein
MLAFRSVCVGLLGAILYFVLHLPLDKAEHRCECSEPRWSFVHIAHGVDPEMIPSLLHVEPHEHVLQIDGNVIVNDIYAGALLVEHARSGELSEVILADAAGQQRRLFVTID